MRIGDVANEAGDIRIALRGADGTTVYGNQKHGEVQVSYEQAQAARPYGWNMVRKVTFDMTLVVIKR